MLKVRPFKSKLSKQAQVLDTNLNLEVVKNIIEFKDGIPPNVQTGKLKLPSVDWIIECNYGLIAQSATVNWQIQIATLK